MEEEESGNKWGKILFILAVVIISGLIIWFVGGMLSEPIEPPKKTVQEIKVIRPPPPPPEVEEEPPPEPEVEEEVDIPEPEPEALPDVPDMEPPPGDLGLDADGVAGGDAFGLAARKGGRSLLSSGSGSRFAWYGNIVKTEINESLNEEEKLRSKAYRVQCHIWLDRSGNIKNFKLINSTGDNELDSIIKNVLNSFSGISEKPPLEMDLQRDMPIKLLFQSR